MTATLTEHTFRIRIADAQQVHLIGTFNDWSTIATPMQQVAPNVWEARLIVGPGRHRYGYFVVDARWHGNTLLEHAHRTRLEGGSRTLQTPSQAKEVAHAAA